MRKIKIDWVSISLMLAVLLFNFMIYNRLPEQLPAHWDFEGKANLWVHKSFLFVFDLGIFVVYSFFTGLQWFDKKGYLEERINVFLKVVRLIITVLIVLNMFVISAALGYNIKIARLFGILISLFFIFLGNVLPQLKPNIFAGIRTKWTLKDPVTWRRTHHIGGYFTIGMGIVMLLTSLTLPENQVFIAMMIVVLLWAVASTLLSYLIFNKKI